MCTTRVPEISVGCRMCLVPVSRTTSTLASRLHAVARVLWRRGLHRCDCLVPVRTHREGALCATVSDSFIDNV